MFPNNNHVGLVSLPVEMGENKQPNVSSTAQPQKREKSSDSGSGVGQILHTLQEGNVNCLPRKRSSQFGRPMPQLNIQCFCIMPGLTNCRLRSICSSTVGFPNHDPPLACERQIVSLSDQKGAITHIHFSKWKFEYPLGLGHD